MEHILQSLLELFKPLLSVVSPLNLFILSFLEAIFFPVPPDAVLLPLLVMRPEIAWFSASVATAGSVLGAAVGYFVGKAGGQPLLSRFIADEKLVRVRRMFDRYDMWAIGVAGFTPIPYKVFALSAGLFGLRLRRFLLASVLSRGARFGLEALLVLAYGKTMVPFIEEKFGIITFGLVALLIAVYGFYRIVLKKRIS